jgi:tetratricopeptide (TPR) repeat protein
LADEPVSAWREPWRVRAGRWTRRHQATVAAVAAGVLVALLAGGTSLWWLQRQWAERQAEAARQEATLHRDVEVGLEQAAGFRRRGHFAEADELLEQARQRLELAGPDDLRERVEQARADTALAQRLDAARLQAATWVEGKFDREGAERRYAAAFRDSGLRHEGEDVAAVAARLRDSAVRQEVVAALDDWASITGNWSRRVWLLRVARSVDRDPLRDRLRQPELWRDGPALARLAEEARAAGLSPQLAVALGRALSRSGGDAVALLAAVQARFPHDFWLNFALGDELGKAKRRDEAIGYYRAALALRPHASAVHNNLGGALKDKGLLDDATDHWKQALHFDPKHSSAHYNLGNALAGKGLLDEAIGHYQQAIQSDPKLAWAHNNLGLALKDKGRLDEAISHFQQALQIDPKEAPAHLNLGQALKARGRLDEAIDHYHQALQIDPKLAGAHYNLGLVLQAKRRLDEAIGHYQQALEIDPKDANAHGALGLALQAKGHLDEAMGHYQQAIQIDPKDAKAHAALGQGLLAQGRFREAGDATRRCLDLLPQSDPHRRFVTPQLQQCEQFLELEGRLPAVLRGDDQPDAPQRLRYADLCVRTKRYAAAARLFAEAFAAQPKRADDLRAQSRYNAACAAARAAAGQGGDTAKLDAKERARLRQQALDWLRADLALWAKTTDRAVLQRTLAHWQQDPDLASLRDKDALAKLPEAEREAWKKLWQEVEALLTKPGEKK